MNRILCKKSQQLLFREILALILSHFTLQNCRKYYCKKKRGYQAQQHYDEKYFPFYTITGSFFSWAPISDFIVISQGNCKQSLALLSALSRSGSNFALSDQTSSVGAQFFLCERLLFPSLPQPKLSIISAQAQACNVFESRTVTGSALLYLTSLHTAKLMLLSLFLRVDTISLKIWERPLSWRAKCSLPVAVRGSKTCMLKLPKNCSLAPDTGKTSMSIAPVYPPSPRWGKTLIGVLLSCCAPVDSLLQLLFALALLRLNSQPFAKSNRQILEIKSVISEIKRDKF